MVERKNKERQTNYWFMFSIIAPVLAFSWLTLSTVPILTTSLITEGLTYEQVGLLTTLFLIANIPASFLTGSLINVFGSKSLLVVGAAIGAMSTYLFTLAPNFLAMIACRCGQGVSAAIFLTGGYHFLSLWFPPQKQNIAISAYNASYWVGIALVYLTFPILLAMHYKWRLLVQAIAILFGIVGGIFWWWSKEPELKEVGQSDKDQIETKDSYKSLFRNLGAYLIVVINFGVWVQLAGVVSWVPPYLEEACKLSANRVGLVSMVLILVMVPAQLLGGWLADRTGKRIVVIMIGMLISVSTVLMPWMKEAHLLLLLGTCIFIAWGSSMATGPAASLPSMILLPKMLGLGFGIVVAGICAGSAFGTYLGGYMIEKTGSYDLFFIICGLSLIAPISICPMIKKYYLKK